MRRAEALDGGAPMNREKWLTERQRGLGASDAAAALGLSKWKTPYQLFLEKRGEAAPIEESEPMRWGKILEPVVLQEYSNRTGRRIRTFEHEMHWSKEHPFLFYSPDAKVIDEPRNVQAKTARTREGWGEPGSDQIPQDYLIQVQHEMLVSVLPVTDVPILFGGQDFALYEVPADRELQQMILEGEHEFWQRVERGEPPDPVNLNDVNLRYGRRSIPNSMQASSELLEACMRLKALRAESERVKAVADAIEVEIKAFLGDNEAVVHGREVICTWKQQKGRTSFDHQGLREIHPDLHAQFIKEGEPFRRFILK